MFSDLIQNPTFGVEITPSYQFYNVGIDPVIASVASHRLRQLGQWVDPTDKEIVEHITDDDRSLAKEIRDYYTAKLTIQAVGDKPLRGFRADLLSYLTSENKKADQESYPMIYRLPEFYREDQIFARVSSLTTNGWRKEEERLLLSNKQRHELEFLDTHVRLTNQSKTRLFWFKRILDDRLVKVSIDIKNPLINLFIDFVDKHAIITLVGKYVCLTLDGQDFYKLDNWNLEI